MAAPPTLPRAQQRFDPGTFAALNSLEFKARYVMEGFLSGLHESPFRGFSVEFSDYRNYQPGDNLRHLDWRLYARTDRLCLKRYMLETNVRFYIVADTSASMRYRGSRAWASKFECAQVMAAALTYMLLKQNDAGGLVTLAAAAVVPGFIRPSQRPSHFGQILRALEAMAPAGDEQLSRLLGHAARLVHRRSIILFFSDLLEASEEVALGFKQLRFQGHECIVFQVLDADELDFPFTESRIFEDLETGRRRVVAPALARQRYLERFAAFMQGHQDLFRQLEIPHCIVRTDQDPCGALGTFLAARRRLK